MLRGQDKLVQFLLQIIFKKYCECSHIFLIIIITIWLIENPNGCWEPPMDGWEPKSSPPFWGTQLRGYAVTRLRGYAYGIV